MASWPATLPQSPLARSYQEVPPNNLLRTAMDVGPDKIRKRTTSEVRRFSFSMFFTQAQIEILDDFVQSTISGGVDSFTWKNHRTDDAATVRLVGIPSYRELGGGNFYTVGMTIEELP